MIYVTKYKSPIGNLILANKDNYYNVYGKILFHFFPHANFCQQCDYT